MEDKQPVTLNLTTEEMVSTYAALITALDLTRDKQELYLSMHESPKVGAATRAEAWQAFIKWQRHETELCETINKLKTSTPADLPFSAFVRFS